MSATHTPSWQPSGHACVPHQARHSKHMLALLSTACLRPPFGCVLTVCRTWRALMTTWSWAQGAHRSRACWSLLSATANRPQQQQGVLVHTPVPPAGGLEHWHPIQLQRSTLLCTSGSPSALRARGATNAASHSRQRCTTHLQQCWLQVVLQQQARRHQGVWEGSSSPTHQPGQSCAKTWHLYCCNQCWCWSRNQGEGAGLLCLVLLHSTGVAAPTS